LRNIFNLLDTGFFSSFKRVPASLEGELQEYARLMEARSRSIEKLILRLQLSRQILDAMHRAPEIDRQHLPSLALSWPEVTEALLILWQHRQKTQQAIRHCLRDCAIARILNLRQWLKLLEGTFGPQATVSCVSSLNHITAQIELEATSASLAALNSLHQELDRVAADLDPLAREYALDI
jgi:hypothetical protein